MVDGSANMHEVGLMHEALRIALEHANAAHAKRIHALTLRVGRLAGVEIEAIKLAFDVVKTATPADGATLVIDEVPVQCWCAICDRLFSPVDSVFRCPACQGISEDVRQGREFDLIAVEVS